MRAWDGKRAVDHKDGVRGISEKERKTRDKSKRRWYIHPDSTLLGWWECAVWGVAIWLAIYTPAFLSFCLYTDDYALAPVSSCVLEWVLLVDVLIHSTYIGYIDEATSQLVTEHGRIRSRFIYSMPGEG
jgi:hypothetical protein